jgi:hypothetical protein
MRGSPGRHIRRFRALSATVGSSFWTHHHYIELSLPVMVSSWGLKIASAAALLALVMPSIVLGVAPGQIKNLVTFGDSYTDSSYYPAADGGYQWPTWVAEYGPFNLYGESLSSLALALGCVAHSPGSPLVGFARSGATCSNLLTYRPFPPIMEWQIPAYLNETYDGTLTLSAQETMYTIWIGTNDLGVNALLTGSDAPGVSIVPVRECVINVLKRLYESGARNFIIQNVRREPVLNSNAGLF